MSNDQVHAGYLPLLDSAVLVVAARLGFAERNGIDLQLHRERSWASIRDRTSVGHFDCAQMPAPLPIAMSLGLGPLSTQTIAPMVLNTGGNAVTVGTALASALADEAPVDVGPAEIGAALARAVKRRMEKTGQPLRFAVVHRFSCHNYDLRYWLAACGIVPDRDVEITVAPPSLMPDALVAGQIDGFSAGEPWNTIAVRRGAGQIVATKAEIAPNTPEKVLGITGAFLADRRDTCMRLIESLLAAGRWCDDPANFGDLARLMAERRHIGADPNQLMSGLTGEIVAARGANRVVPDFLTFAKPHGNTPSRAYAAWLFAQMVRWNQCEASDENRRVADRAYRPDLFAEAAGVSGDGTEHQEQTATFGFFDGEPVHVSSK